jgi:hypothetical protein
MKDLHYSSMYFHLACEEELTQKYGKGETHVRKCDSCDYEQLIHSGGVHASASGVLKVYAYKDEFSCPNFEKESRSGLDQVNIFIFFNFTSKSNLF